MNGAYIINNNYTKNFRPETINLIKKDVTLKKNTNIWISQIAFN